MDDKQIEFVTDNELEYTKLYGVPGGGKTKCIIEKILYLLKHNIITHPNEFLVLTFSKHACEDFIRKGKVRNNAIFSHNNIKTIHSACYSILLNSNSNKIHSYNISTIIYECSIILEKFKNSYNEVIDSFIHKNEKWKTKKVIFIDEAQDISKLQYDFIMALANIYNCKVIMIGDPNQNIFQFQNGTDKYLLEHPGKHIQLSYNYRSSRDIVEFINYFRPWNMYNNINTNNDYFRKPYIFSSNKQGILQHLILDLIKTNVEYHKIAIIAPIKLSKPNVISLSMIINELIICNIPFVKHYNDTDTDNNYNHTKDIEYGKINIFTIHASKGLEFDKVYLCNFHLNSKGSLPTYEENMENKYLWYVGMSRAKKYLTIYSLTNQILFPSIYSCSKDLYKSNINITSREYSFKKKPKTVEVDVLPIKSFLNSKKWFDEHELYKLHKLFEYEETEVEMFHSDVQLYEYTAYATLYGLFIEDWIFYKTAPLYRYTYIKQKQYDWKVPLPLHLWRYISVVKKKYKNIHYYETFLEYIDPHNENDREILKILMSKDEYKNNYFDFCYDKGVCYYDKTLYLYNIKLLEDNKLSLTEQIKTVWNIVLFKYQIDFECKYYLEKDFSNHLITLETYIKCINDNTTLGSNTLFQIPVYSTEVGIKGMIDALDDKNVIYEFKFCKDTNLQAVLQLFIYASIYYSNLLHKTVELWNLQTGKKYVYKFTKNNIDEINSYLIEIINNKSLDL
jgi:hypothetical protein